MHSGETFTPLLSQDYTNTDSGAPRPDLIGDPYNFSNAISEGCPAESRRFTAGITPAAFALPALAPAQSFTREYGNARRGSPRGPAIYNVDASLFKNLNLTEHVKMQFRVEAFNLFNTPEFALPDAAVDQAGSPGTPILSGSITSTGHASRELQLALKLSF